MNKILWQQYGLSEIAGWSSLEARRAHNPKVGGSSPPKPTTNLFGLQNVP